MSTLFGLTAPIVVLVGLLALAAWAFWLWMLIDAALHEPSDGVDKVVWVLVIVLLPFVGSVAYFVFRRPDRIARHGA